MVGRHGPVCYYLLFPERIRERRQPYYEALRETDRIWHRNLDVSSMEAYLAELLQARLEIGIDQARSLAGC